jgi:hypothetical protein
MKTILKITTLLLLVLPTVVGYGQDEPLVMEFTIEEQEQEQEDEQEVLQQQEQIFADDNAQDDDTHQRYIAIEKAYFYDEPITNSIVKKAYLVEGDKVVALNKRNGFIYVEFTNPQSHRTTKG